MPKQPIKINQFLLQQRSMSQLLKKKAQHEVILKSIKDSLPPAMRLQCVTCVHQSHELILYVKTAAWATQIRYYEPLILKQLHSSTNTHFGKIQVRIQPSILLAKIEPKKASLPSLNTINAIQACAFDYPPGKLKQSLLRLIDVLKRGAEPS